VDPADQEHVSSAISQNGSASTASRWIGVGSASLSDPRRAGKAATSAALQGPDPRLLIVFCSDSFDPEALLASINEVADGVPVIGCSTAGEISSSGPGDAGVVVTALGGDFEVSTAVGLNAAEGLRRAGAEAASCISAISDRPHRAVLLLTDGLAGDQQEIVRGAYGAVGAAVPLVGGCAGDDLKMRTTHQLYADRVLTDAVVAAAIGSEAPIGIGVRHGWRKVGEPMLVTASLGNRVHSLDDRPALDVYLERLNAPESARTDPAAFTRFATTHPLGLERRGGEEVRFVGEADFEDRSLGCIADVPQGGLTWFMAGDDQSVLDATDGACRAALDGLAGHRPIGMIAFDCIARRGVLGEEGIEREVERVAEHAEGAPVAGFYTYGEIARVRGVTGFHNQTLVVLAVS
jgi:hypothetical protein